MLKLNRVSDACNGLHRNDHPNSTVKELEMGHPDGHYKIAYTPSLTGIYKSSIMLQSQGEVLTTFFKN